MIILHVRVEFEKAERLLGISGIILWKNSHGNGLDGEFFGGEALWITWPA
jgi:hypothetical protein